MAQKWNITVETQSGETYAGAMTRQQPEIVNGFVAIATESGEWNYLKPDTVTRMHFSPVVDKPEEKPVEAAPTPDKENEDIDSDIQNDPKAEDEVGSTSGGGTSLELAGG
ncbi:hypothetical protein [Yersinia sp. 2105 StPb PI]|uniref:hypothetical protein n=1 Tax=Yersinia sp. 2105 StPb PI TaxID=2507058 RepID=UPI0005E86F22|nr:hypothetical protein [Yersinia sp. 2105 StPb PI]RXA93885.1 hypothetical protein EQP49_21755 [Yersinia sp. 2105 StPb PI]CNL30724.1 Uncharacterised protein [Yersinia frederiksenii]